MDRETRNGSRESVRDDKSSQRRMLQGVGEEPYEGANGHGGKGEDGNGIRVTQSYRVEGGGEGKYRERGGTGNGSGSEERRVGEMV